MAGSSNGIVTTILPPIVTAAKRDEPQVIPGRSGSLHMQDGAYEQILKPCSVYLPYEQGVTVAALNAIRAWLTGYGTVSFSNDPGREYRGHIVSKIDWNEWLNGFEDREAQIIWECEPYAYHTNAQTFSVSTSGQTVNNPGTAEARPLLAVTGSGDVELMVGLGIVQLVGMSGTVYIDCEAEECYSLSGTVRVNKNGIMGGEFPTIPTGTSLISWTGSVTGISVTPHWRDI